MPRLSSPRRVAVTGVGLVSPLGIGNVDNWAALVAGRSGVGPITQFDAAAFDCARGPLFHLGAEVCHPSLCILGWNNKLDRPLTGFKAKIGNRPHTAGTIGDLNLSARLLLWHWT